MDLRTSLVIVLVMLVQINAIGLRMQNRRVKKLARGKKANIENHPYQIGYFQMTENRENEEKRRMTKFCSGSIINDNWVVTAGHCLNTKYEGAFTEFICSGSSYINCKNGTLHKIDKRVVHPEYKEAFDKSVNDIALLRVVNPFVYSERVQRIALATYQPGFFTKATLSGWGISENGKMSPQLMESTHYIEPNFICRFFLGTKLKEYKNSSIICSLSRSFICSGDSGGPLVVNNTLVGVTSMGLSNQFCERLYFAQSFFTTVAEYANWINVTMEEYDRKDIAVTNYKDVPLLNEVMQLE